jgi:hypothetical protein
MPYRFRWTQAILRGSIYTVSESQPVLSQPQDSVDSRKSYRCCNLLGDAVVFLQWTNWGQWHWRWRRMIKRRSAALGWSSPRKYLPISPCHCTDSWGRHTDYFTALIPNIFMELKWLKSLLLFETAFRSGQKYHNLLNTDTLKIYFKGAVLANLLMCFIKARRHAGVWGSWGMAPRIPNISARWTWVIDFTLR